MNHRLFEDESINRRFNRGQWKVIILTLIGYTLFYFMRKNFSFAMPGLAQDLGVSKAMLGNCLMAGGLIYGVSKFLNGFIGDRVKAKHLFCAGLAACALVNLAFGFAPEIAGWFLDGEVGTRGARALPDIAPVVGGADIAPVVDGADIAPVVDGADIAPVVDGADIAPVVGGAEIAPVVGDADIAPVVDGADIAPVVDGADIAPVVNGADIAPVVGGADIAPVVGGADIAPVVDGADSSLPAAGTIAVVLGVLFVINQFFQGMGFPPCAKLIAHWVPPKELATKMSIWNCSHSIGGGIVAKICGVIMALGVIGSANQGIGMWKWCFWTMAALGALGLVAMWLWLPGTPEEEGLPPVPGTGGERRMKKEEGKRVDVKIHCPSPPPISTCSAVFLNPVIWLLGITNLTVNAARALISDWGPTMLQEAKGLSSSAAGTELMLFEFAGIAGMLFGGWATDRLAGGRVPRVCVFMMATAVLALFGFWFLPVGVACTVTLCLFGFSLYGPQALTGVAVANLCGKKLAGTSIGFISLFSYVGAALSGKFCGSLVQASGSWYSPIMAIAATVAVGTVVFLALWRTKAHNYEETLL